MEFQAVIMAAGKGSRMTDLTSRCPKALLPIGSRPLIWYPLNFLYKNGFRDCIIVLPANQRSEIGTALNALDDVRIEWKEHVFQGTDDGSGTADALRQVIHDCDIKVDLLVVSCDLVTDVSLEPLFALHYARSSKLTALFAPLPSDLRTTVVPGPKMKKKIDRDFVGMDPITNQMLLMASEADFDDDVLTFNRYILTHCPRFVIQSNLLDSHVYIVSRSLTDIWANDGAFNSFKGEVVPLLTKKQFKKTVSTSNRIITSIRDPKEMSSSNGNMGFVRESDYGCYAHVSNQGFCLRTNNLATYCYTSRQMLRLWPSFASSDADRGLVHSETLQSGDGTTIGQDCLVAKNVQVGSQTTVKSSIIGQDCKLGSNVKLTNCIIMDKVTIKDGCILQGCVVGRDVLVDHNCQLKDCVLSVDQVLQNTKLSGEVIANEDGLMEID